MADILLTHAYYLKLDPKQWKAQQPFPPLALLYAASYLRSAGYDPAFHDVMFSESPGNLQMTLDKHHPKFLVIYEDGFNYLTKMCLTNMREAAFEMINVGKQSGCKVIVSGSDATDHSDQFLQKGADFIVVGEGEQTLRELIKAIDEKTDWSNISGLRYLCNNKMVSTQKRRNLSNLDQIPFPAWDLVDMTEYKKRWLNSNGYFSLNMVTTRGCPYKCNWCAKPVYGNLYHSRSAENVVEELKYLKSTFQFDRIWFCDDIFGLKPAWIKKFADLVASEKLDIKFKIQSRADLLLEEENIESLARAGCDEIWVGAESGSQIILNAMDKGITVEQIYRATNLMKANGIKPCFFLQFGYPGETKDDIDKTLKLLFELMPHDIGVSVSYPLPGTKFYDQVKSQLTKKTNWKDSDDLAMMFHNTYPAEYYKKLQRYVHHEFRKRQALRCVKENGDFSKLLSLAYRFPQSMISKMMVNGYDQ